MPRIQANGIQLYYETHGQGAPLVLIQGLGHSANMWFKQVPTLAREFQVIVFDNRGTGQSDRPPGPYSISLMARDVIGLLDQLEISAAHVLGVSMGGFIAQELAICSPTRVKKLILLNTCYGNQEFWAALKQMWPGYVPLDTSQGFEGWRLFSALYRWPSPLRLVRGLVGPEAVYRHGLRYLVTPEFYRRNPHAIRELVQRAFANPPSLDTLRWQLQATGAFNSESHLKQIRAPTLVLGAREDRIIPLVLTQKLAECIPQAQFAVIENAGHLAFIEQAEEFNHRVITFLKGGDS